MPDSSPYLTKTEDHLVNGVIYHIHSLKNRQQYDDPEGIAAKLGISSSLWPLFGQVWPSGLVLADIMSTCAVENIAILELGCGLGLASMIANARGATVTASDVHPLTETFMRENTRLNNFPTTPYRACDWSKLDPALGKFDLIIGSDLLYETEHPVLLASFIDQHTHHKARVIMIDPGRKLGGRFTRHMETFGFHCGFDRERTPYQTGLGFSGKVLRFQRAK